MNKKISVSFIIIAYLCIMHSAGGFSREQDAAIDAPRRDTPARKDNAVTGTPETAKQKSEPDKNGDDINQTTPSVTADTESSDKRKASPINDNQDTDISALKKRHDKELKHILALLAELSADGKTHTFAPVFLTEHKNIAGSITDIAFRWVGFKMALTFTQRDFPVKNLTLQEMLIGSFLYASGTNLGFIGGRYREENRFYTNYISEILILRWKALRYCDLGAGIGSRQYFFIRKDTPPGFKMPKNHASIFPRALIDIGMLQEKGVDSLTHGIVLSAWGGYGYRSDWEEWGAPGDMRMGKKAQDFFIYSATFTAGMLFLEDYDFFGNHNIVLKAKYKGGVDNDFLSRPRFGGTIDNSKKDLVHGFTLDEFRVNEFVLINLSYGFDIIERLRLNIYADYSHVTSPYPRNIIGVGYGIRLKTVFNIPLWFTHGIGKELEPYDKKLRMTFMLMLAAGW